LPRIPAPEAAVLASAGVVVTHTDAAGQAGLELCQTADLPSAGYFAGQIVLAAEERQVVKAIDHQDVTGIELGRPPEIVRVVSVRDNIALVGTIVFALCQGVGDAKQYAVGEAPVEGRLERVVPRTGDVVGLPNRVVALVRPQG